MKALVFCILSMLFTTLIPSVYASTYIERKDVQDFIDKLVTENKLEKRWLRSILTQAKRKDDILEAISKPAEKTKTLKQYKPIFIDTKKIKRGVRFWHQHEKKLKRAEKIYGVPAEIIVAIIGVETQYGGYLGNYRVLDALATLGFDYAPRSDFFLKQLKEFLVLADEGHVDVLRAKGSYAGAMGLPQFIPSSYRHYAVDFNQDGRIDLIGSVEDAIGSAANYLSKHHWQKNSPIVAKVNKKNKADLSLYSGKLELSHDLDEAWKKGWKVSRKPSGKQKVMPLKFMGEQGEELWLGFNNFYVITRYNRSSKYAMTVYQLAASIKNKTN